MKSTSRALMPRDTYKVLALAVKNGLSKSADSLAKLGQRQELSLSEMEDVMEIHKTYGAMPYKIGDLIRRGCSINDIQTLYEARDHFGPEQLSLIKLNEFYREFHGEGDIDEDLLGNSLACIPEDTFLYTGNQLSRALELREENDGLSLEHICDILERESKFTASDFR